MPVGDSPVATVVAAAAAAATARTGFSLERESTPAIHLFISPKFRARCSHPRRYRALLTAVHRYPTAARTNLGESHGRVRVSINIRFSPDPPYRNNRERLLHHRARRCVSDKFTFPPPTYLYHPHPHPPPLPFHLRLTSPSQFGTRRRSFDKSKRCRKFHRAVSNEIRLTMFPAARGNAIPQSQQNHSRPTVSIGRESRGSRRKLGRSCQVLSLSVFLLSPLVSLPPFSLFLACSRSRCRSLSLVLQRAKFHRGYRASSIFHPLA